MCASASAYRDSIMCTFDGLARSGRVLSRVPVCRWERVVSGHVVPPRNSGGLGCRPSWVRAGGEACLPGIAVVMRVRWGAGFVRAWASAVRWRPGGDGGVVGRGPGEPPAPHRRRRSWRVGGPGLGRSDSGLCTAPGGRQHADRFPRRRVRILGAAGERGHRLPLCGARVVHGGPRAAMERLPRRGPGFRHLDPVIGRSGIGGPCRKLLGRFSIFDHGMDTTEHVSVWKPKTVESRYLYSMV